LDICDGNIKSKMSVHCAINCPDVIMKSLLRNHILTKLLLCSLIFKNNFLPNGKTNMLIIKIIIKGNNLMNRSLADPHTFGQSVCKNIKIIS